MNSLNSASDPQIDEAILAVTANSWRKVALVILASHEKLRNSLPEGDSGLDLIAKRIEALVQNGHLFAQGDVKKWRHSEVRKAA